MEATMKTALRTACVLVVMMISVAGCKNNPLTSGGSGGTTTTTATTSTSGTISTIAGSGIPPGYSANNGEATAAYLGYPFGLATDSSGNVYFADSYNTVVRKITPSGTIVTVAGNGAWGYSGDGGSATLAGISDVRDVATDNAGNVYIADGNNHVIRRVSTSGVITTVAGNGNYGYSGDGGQATSAELSWLNGVAVDASGNLYIADTGNSVIRMVNTSGTISTVAGNGTAGYTGDGGPATSAELSSPSSIAVDAAGNLYIADTANNVIRMVNTSGTISTVAGNGTTGYTGDGGPATSAGLSWPSSVAVDASGNLYIADTNHSVIRMVDASGTISTVAGNGVSGYSGDGGSAASAQLSLPSGIAADASGNLYISDAGNFVIRKVSTAGTISTLAGRGVSAAYSADKGQATDAVISGPDGIAVDSSANVYLVSGDLYVVRKVTSSGTIATVAGLGLTGYSQNGALATNTPLNWPNSVAVDSSGDFYITDGSSDVVDKVNTSDILTIVAGSGSNGYSGDGGAATSAKLNSPEGVAVDSSGNIYIADTNNNRVRKVDTSGIITTIAGTGTAGYSGDGGSATSAELSSPKYLAVDSSGNIYVADTGNNRVRKITTTGTITTVAGNGTSGYSADGGLATSAQLGWIGGIAMDSSGNLYIADGGNNRIRKVDTSGIITTIVGTGTAGYSGDGGSAASAELHGPNGIAVDSSGNLYIADSGNFVVRKVSK